MLRFLRWAALLVGALGSSVAFAQGANRPTSPINGADTVWVLISAGLVMLMTPGLAFFYGGMVRQKNVLTTLLQSFICLGVISVQWMLFGYSLVFSSGNGFIGGLGHLGLAGIPLNGATTYAPTIPALVFVLYQMMFAVITPALISGAFAERVKFSAYLLFVIAWATFIYDPIAHWFWGAGGWLGAMGALDFAGGSVIHISSGISALVFVLVIGRRIGYPDEEMRPHDLPLTLIGTGLLWFGWFGFNGGSALSIGPVAAVAVMNTHLAAAAGALVWMAVEWRKQGQPTALGIASGAVAGLATVTQGAGYIAPFAALVFGVCGGLACYSAVLLKVRLKYDDALDTFGVHGVGGIIGALLTGLFASSAINAAGRNGLFNGNPSQLLIQATGVVATAAYAALGTWILLKVIDAMVGLRVSPADELAGLDVSQHGEMAYHGP